jgi:hypothetical protein
MTRILEMICAVKEAQETGEEPTGLLSQVVLADAEQLVSGLVETLIETKPDNFEFGAIHGITNEQVADWMDNAVDEIFRREGNSDADDE